MNIYSNQEMVQVFFISEATDKPIVPIDFSDCFFSILDSNVVEGEIEEWELRPDNGSAAVNSHDL